MFSRTRLFLPVLAGLLALPALARADDEGTFGEALSIARNWLSEIDAGKYDQSYNEAGSALHDKVPQETWDKILNTERPVLGRVVAREEVSHVLRPGGLEGVAGTFLIVTYHTNFESKPDEQEIVVMKREFTGWRCVGYNFGPANPQAADADGQPSTTTTDETVTPPTNGMTVPAQSPAAH